MNILKAKKTAGKTVIYALAVIVLIIQVYPIFWIFCTSLKSQAENTTTLPYQLPQHITFQNYVEAWNKSSLPVYFINSIIVVSCTLIGILILSACAGFAIEKMQFRLSKTVMFYFLMGITIPIHVTLIPLFQIFKSVGIINTRLSLVLPMIGFNLAMSIYLFTAFYKFVPNELIEAAVIDGASIWKAFVKIILPMSKNTIITVLTMNLIFTWNEFVFANTFINDTKLKTIPVGLYDYVGSKGMVNWGATFAAISMFMLPILIVYFILNKGIIAGMSAGAIKE